MIIDVWMQHPTARFGMDAEMLAPLRRWTGVEVSGGETSLESTLQVMDAASVGKGLLSAWWGPGGALISNDEVAEVVAKAPDRLAGVASVDISNPIGAVRELRRAVDELGFKALRIVPWLWGLPPNDRHYYPLYVACVELKIPFCTQVGYTGPLRTSETGRPIPYLEDVALDFPDLTIVGGHVGYPWTEEMIALSRKYPNVYIDTSAYAVRRYPSVLVSYLQTGGAKKVMFGSNYPMLTPNQALMDFDSLQLDAENASLFLSDNARRIFRIEE